MAVLPVLSLPDARLRQKAIAVDRVDDTIVTLMNDMIDTIHHDNGIGLAANQVGVLKRIIVIDIGPEYHSEPYKMVNPMITWHSDDHYSVQEGCLSVPNQWSEIKRYNSITVDFTDQNNKPQQIKADGLLSCCIQHEIDHLDGVLFIDHLSQLKRRLLANRAVKMKRIEIRHGSTSP